MFTISMDETGSISEKYARSNDRRDDTTCSSHTSGDKTSSESIRDIYSPFEGDDFDLYLADARQAYPFCYDIAIPVLEINGRRWHCLWVKDKNARID